MEEKIRLDKFLSDMTAKTRKEIKEAIRKGRVRREGKVLTSSDFKVFKNDTIFLDGVAITYRKFYYYMLHKPAGVISSTEKGATKTVIDVFVEAGGSCPFLDSLSPVGRLDKDTEGLLLLSNDGEMIHRLLSPKKEIRKLYYVELDKPSQTEDILAFREGLDLGDFISKEAELELLEEGSRAYVTITEGKFHQIKRMFEKVGKNVVYLKRLSMGSLKLDESLPIGSFRELTADEIFALKYECGLVS